MLVPFLKKKKKPRTINDKEIIDKNSYSCVATRMVTSLNRKIILDAYQRMLTQIENCDCQPVYLSIECTFRKRKFVKLFINVKECTNSQLICHCNIYRTHC